MIPDRFAILDPAAGISGDMVLGALVDVGLPTDWLADLPARLSLDGVSIRVERVMRCRVASTKVHVMLPGGVVEQPAEAVQGAHGHGHHHGEGDGPHRQVGELITIIRRAALSPWVTERAVQAFQLLAEAEGRVHGMPPAEVTLHEVGAWDALVDIVGAVGGFEALGLQRIYHRPVAIGSGWIRAAHGILPVPAPATTHLLEGLEIAPDGPVSGEAATPTGVALLRVLSQGEPPARWRIVRSGWGAGGRDPHEYPNALRLMVAESVREAAEVVVVATDMDDLAPEYLPPLRDALEAAGALDVQTWPTHGKKGRTGFRLEVTVGRDGEAAVTEALFRHSTTAGVRRWIAERVTLARRELEVKAEDGTMVRVKVLDGPDGPRVKPEYDDIRALAARLGRPAHEIADEIKQRAGELLREQHGRASF